MSCVPAFLPLIALWTGKKPTLRTYQMICFYFCGMADEHELMAHIEKFSVKQGRSSKSAYQSRELPNADVEIGHRSISVCHLVNITRELGRKLQWNPATEQFVGDDAANQSLDRPKRAGF